MLKEQFQSRISAALTPQTTKKLENQINAYIDSNSELLMSLDYSRRYSFADKDRQVLYDAVGISEEEFTGAVAASKAIHKNNKIQSNPFYLLSVLTAGYYLSKKDTNHATLLILYMSLNMYTSIHKGEFKYNANKQIMDYTIAHLDSAFIIANTPSLYAFLIDNTRTVVETYAKRMMNGEDQDLTYVADATWTRLRQKMVRLGKEYYKNHMSGSYLNADTDHIANDGETYREIDNDSFMIDRLSNKVYLKLLNRQYDSRLIKYSITKSNTSYQKIKNLIDDIIDGDEDNEIRRVVSSMIEYYLAMSGKSADYIAKGDFIAYMKSAYGASSNNPAMDYTKTTIDKWLDANITKYGRTNFSRTARQGYRKTIFMFLVFMINTEAKAS